jgi:aubergine-like protein
MNKVMICGIDTYHDSQKKGSSVCAFIATANQEKTRFFSRASLQDTHQELSNNLTLSMKCKFNRNQANDKSFGA